MGSALFVSVTTFVSLFIRVIRISIFLLPLQTRGNVSGVNSIVLC